MQKNKTVPTEIGVVDFLSLVENDKRREDAFRLLELFKVATGVEPVMWGPSMIGFGTNHYRYESGREGDSLAVGFAARTSSLVLYGLLDDGDLGETLDKLGKVKVGKGCLYVNRLEDIDSRYLKTLVKQSFKLRNNVK